MIKMTKFSIGGWAWVLAVLLSGVSSARAQEQDLVQASLVADVSAIAPGEPFHVGVLFSVQEAWHIYWQNPGDAGMATELNIVLPEGFEVGPVQYPVPHRFVDPGDIVGYGYEEQVLLLARVTPPDDLAPGTQVPVRAEAVWLACRHICIAGDADLELTLDTAREAVADNEALFAQWRQRLPQSADESLAAVRTDIADGRVELQIDWSHPVEQVEWFPLPPEFVFLENVSTATSDQTTTITFDAPRGQGQVELPFVLAYRDGEGRWRGVRSKAEINGSE